MNWIWIILLGLFVGSCEDYLDRSPDDGLSEDDVYKDYSSLLGFMDRIFQNDDILIFTHGINSYSNTYVTVGNLSDEYASVRDNDPSKFVNAGNWLENAGTRFEIGSKSDGKNFKSAISRAYTGLRIVNRVISGVDQVKSITDDQRRKLLGQAHFLRAYFYFVIGFEDDIGTAIEIAAPLGGIAFFLLAIKELMVTFCIRHALRTTS